jgi:hypothetical protein
MITWQEIIQRYHIKYHNQITKTTKPLQDSFDITCVDYLKIYNDGHFAYLTSRPECSEYYASEQLYSVDPYFRHPSTHQTGFFCIENNSSSDFICKMSNKFNFQPPLVFTEKGSNYVELFCFSGEKSEVLHGLYLHYSQLLKHFSVYFKRELNSVLKKMECELFSLIDLQGDYFHSGLHPASAIDVESLHAYFCAIGKEAELKRATSLSPRERDCLRLLIQGRTAKDSAGELHLSPRTVEFYFEKALLHNSLQAA